MSVDEGLELVGRAAVRERAARRQVRDHHGTLRIEDLRGLRHEVDAAERDDVALDPLRGLGQGQRVAHEVGQILHLRLLVVVGQEHGVALALEREDRLLEVVGKFGVLGIRRCSGHAGN
jgi:hypothetical protein